MGIVIIEGMGACFILLMICVIGIADGAVGLVHLYEKEVRERVIEQGLTTPDKIKKNAICFKIFGIMIPLIFVVASVYGVNGARGFGAGFWQISLILMMQGLFDRFFIDWYWVGKTKAWIIPGTEDLMPYIYGKALIGKRIVTIIGCPVIAAVLSAAMTLFIN